MIERNPYGEPLGRGRAQWRRPTPGLGIGIFIAFFLLMGALPSGALPLLILGGVFTALSSNPHRRAFLIPGGILLGLAAGAIVGDSIGWLAPALAGAAGSAGLGAGFWLVYLLDRARYPSGPAFGWARIPGTILLIIAAMSAAGGISSLILRLFRSGGTLGWSIAGQALAWWPLLVIVLGLGLYLAGHWRERAASDGGRRSWRRRAVPADDGPIWP